MKILRIAGALVLPLGFISNANAGEVPEGVEVVASFDEAKEKPEWFSVDDTVMGGVSDGGVEVKDGVLVFSGKLSMENNGGFSSVRKVVKGSDFSGKDGFVLRVKGDGRTYKLRIETDARYRGSEIGYQADFQTKKGEFIEVKVPFSDFKPGWRGRKLDGPALDLAKVEELGLVLADGKEGDFAIEVDWMGVE